MRLKLLPRINGRRGAFQLLFGVVYGMLTIGTFIAQDFPPALVWLETYLDTPALLAPVWATPALAALIGAFLPRPGDWFSFAAMTFAPAIWGCLYLIGAFVEPHGTSLFGVILYWALAGAVMVVAGMTGDKDRDHRETAVTP
jgi:hypothetical protein